MLSNCNSVIVFACQKLMFLFVTPMFLVLFSFSVCNWLQRILCQKSWTLQLWVFFLLNNFLRSRTISEGLEARCSLKMGLYFPTYNFAMIKTSHFLYIVPSSFPPHAIHATPVMYFRVYTIFKGGSIFYSSLLLLFSSPLCLHTRQYAAPVISG